MQLYVCFIYTAAHKEPLGTHTQLGRYVCLCRCVSVWYLVYAEVLLVAGAVVQDSQAVPAQKMLGVGVKLFKVTPQI